MATGSYKMKLDNQKKEFSIFAEGVFSPELGTQYGQEFIDKSKSINPEEYSLLIDVSKLNTSDADVAQVLSAVLKMYFSFPYKKIYMAKIGNAICMMQVKKLLSTTPGHEKLEFVDNLDLSNL